MSWLEAKALLWFAVDFSAAVYLLHRAVLAAGKKERARRVER